MAQQSYRDPSDRRPRSVYGVGQEADPRFSMANERTMLAYLRTALAVLVTAIALVAVGQSAQYVWTAPVAAAACVISAALAIWAYLHWKRSEIAMRTKGQLPAPTFLAALAGGVFALALAAAVAMLVTAF